MMNFKEFVNMQELDYFTFVDLLLGWFDEYKMDVDTLGHKNRPEKYYNITKQEELTKEEYENLIDEGHFSLNSRARSEYSALNIRFVDIEAEDFDVIMIQELDNDKIGYVYKDDFVHTAIWKHSSTTFIAINDLNEYVAYTYEGDQFPKTEEDLFDLNTRAYFAKGNIDKYFISESVVRNAELDLGYFVDPQSAVFNPKRFVQDMINFFGGFKLNNDLDVQAGSVEGEGHKLYEDLAEVMLHAFVQLKPLGKMQSGPRLKESLESSEELSEVDPQLISSLGYDTVVLFEEIQEGIVGRIFQIMPDSEKYDFLANNPYEEARFFLYDDNSKKKHAVIFKEKHNTWRYKSGFISMNDLNSPAAPYNQGQDIVERNGRKQQNVAFLNTFVFMTYDGEGRDELMKLASKLETDAGVFVGNYMFNVFNSMNRTKREMRKQFDIINKAFDTKVWDAYIDSLNPLGNTLVEYQGSSYYAERSNFVQLSAEFIAHQEEILAEYVGEFDTELRMEGIRKILEHTMSDDDFKKYKKNYKKTRFFVHRLSPIHVLTTYYYVLNVYINQELEAIDDRKDFDGKKVIEKTNEMVWVLYELDRKLKGIDIHDVDTIKPNEASSLSDYSFFVVGKEPSMLFDDASRTELLALVNVLDVEEIQEVVDRIINMQLILDNPSHELTLEFYRPLHDFIKELDTEIVVSQKTERWSSIPYNIKRSRILQSLTLEEYDMLARIKASYQIYDRLDYLELPLNLADPVLLREHNVLKALQQYSRFSEELLDKDYTFFWQQSDRVEESFERYKKDVSEPFVVDEANSVRMNRMRDASSIMDQLDYIIEESRKNNDGTVKTPRIETLKRADLKDFVYLGYNNEFTSFKDSLIGAYIYYIVSTGDALLDVPFEEFMKNGFVFSTAVRKLAYYSADYAKVRHFVRTSDDEYAPSYSVKITSDGVMRIKDYFNQLFHEFKNSTSSPRVGLDADKDWEGEFIVDVQDLVRVMLESNVAMDKKLLIANHVVTYLTHSNIDGESEMLVQLNKVVKFTDPETGEVVDLGIPHLTPTS